MSRAVEALLFASARPLSAGELAELLPGEDVRAALDALAAHYAGRGVRLIERGGAWSFQTAPDLAPLLARERADTRPLSKAALETLAVIAYHEPATRAEVEEVRGSPVARDTLGALLELGWVKPAGRRESPGHPTQYVTTAAFLRAFDLADRRDLPGLDELRAAGLLEPAPPAAPGLL